MITQGSVITAYAARDEAGDILDAPIYDFLLTYGVPYRIPDTQRSKYVAANVPEYQVRLTEPGDWMNYTRSFENTNYYVYLRCASFGATTVYLDQVTGDPTTTNQTTVRLGTFNVANHIMRLNYTYEQLMDGSTPALVNLSGTSTLRLTRGGTNSGGEQRRMVVMDYLLFVPSTEVPVPPTIFDNFNDGTDTAPPADWVHYDPLGGLDASPASYLLTNGAYRIISPAPTTGAYGPARAGSFLSPVYTDFYASVDVIDFDDTVRQAFGIAARIQNPGLGTTDGYLFSWEPGGGTLPGTNNGDLDISRLITELPIDQIENEDSGLHLERGKSYRFAFMGKGSDFVVDVYELPNTTTPLKRLTATDPDALYASGQVGLIVASQGDTTIAADATFDNFLVTTAEPRLSAEVSGGSLVVSWPVIPFQLETSPSVGAPAWTRVTSGISQVGDQNVYTVPVDTEQYFRLVYP